VALPKDIKGGREKICGHFCCLPHVVTKKIDKNSPIIVPGELHPHRGRIQNLFPGTEPGKNLIGL
jgi:hypothetical protein